jgi:hypothetical protein
MEILFTLSTNEVVMLASSTALLAIISVAMAHVVIVLDVWGAYREKVDGPSNKTIFLPN